MASEIDNAVAYNAGDVGSGVGAAVLTPNSLDLSQINAKWNEQNAKDQENIIKAEEEKLKNARGLVSDINPNVKGALDSDADYFRQKAGDITNRYAQLYSKYKGNPDSSEALLEKGRLDAEKNMITQEAMQSAQHKDILLKTEQALVADRDKGIYNKDETANLMAQARVAPSIQERQKIIDANGGNFLVENPLNMSKEFAAGIGGASGLQPDIAVNTPVKDPVTGVVSFKTAKGYSPAQLEQYALTQYSTSPRAQKAADQAYQTLSKQQPLVAKTYEDKAAAANAAAQQSGNASDMRTPQQLFAVDHTINAHQFNQEKLTQQKESEAEKLYWWQRRQQYKAENPDAKDDDWQYRQGVAAVTGGDQGFRAYNTDIQTGNYVGTGSNLEGQLADANKVLVPDGMGGTKSLPNTIVAVKGEYDKNGNFIGSKYITTANLVAAGENPEAIAKTDLYAKMDAYNPNTLSRESLDAMKEANKWKVNLSKFWNKETPNKPFNPKNIAPSANKSFPTQTQPPLTNTAQAGTVTPVTKKVPSATRAEWKKNGWTDDLIEKAVKAGKIKVL